MSTETPKNVIERAADTSVRALAWHHMIIKFCSLLLNKVDAREIASIYDYDYCEEINIHPTNGVDVRALALDISRALNITEPISKEFNAGSGKITYGIKWEPDNYNPPRAIAINVIGGEPRCKVKQVTVTRHIPASEARTEEYVKFALENPEECGVKEA